MGRMDRGGVSGYVVGREWVGEFVGDWIGE